MERKELLLQLTGEENPKFITKREDVIIKKCLELINKQYEGLVQCPNCKNYTDRLHREANGYQWQCPSCYLGYHCFPTPQTKWAHEVIKENNEGQV